MTLRRNALSDERRRRVLRDEHESAADENKDTQKSKPNSTARYNRSALQDQQPRVTEFIPRRRMTLIILGLLMLVAIASVEALYCGVQQWRLSSDSLAAFDVTAPGSLASWVMTVGLVLASGACILIHCVRRHRLDDYRGTYRMWTWLGAATLIGSAFVATSTFGAVQAIIRSQLGNSFWATHGPLIFLSVVIAGIGLRLLIEIRHSRTALVSLLAVGLFGLTAISMEQFFTPGEVDRFPLSLANSWATLAAVGSYLFCLLSYSRHVYLDAQGLLVGAKKKKRVKAKSRSQKKETTANTDNSPELNTKVETSVAKSKRKSKVRRPQIADETVEDHADESKLNSAKSDSDSSNDEEPTATLSYEKMSKTQKRKMRKANRESRRAA